MIVLICGSRGWHEAAPIRLALTELQALAAARGDRLEVLHGAASKGADYLADRIAAELHMRVYRVPAQWEKFGKGAGPIRNQEMLDRYRVDVVLAFRADGKSNGTDDMLRRAGQYDIPCAKISPGQQVSLPALFPAPNG